MIEIREIEKKEIWENFLKTIKEKTFLQSWNWGEFNKLMGNKIWRLGMFLEEKIIAVSLVIKNEAKRGNFLLVPHGPLIIDNYQEKENLLKICVEKIKNIAREEKIDFIRIAPLWEKQRENKTLFENLGFRDAPLHVHPELTWELDITPSPEELLKKMRKTTRYLIRQAEKNKDIEIEEKNDLEGAELFYQIYQLTKERQKFVPFSFEYLKNEFLVFSKDNQISILLGKYRGEVVAGGIFVFWQKIGFYHHGASSQKYAKIPVSYLLLWQAIKKAKEKGCQNFNFWGISPLEKKDHPWYGLSLFKTGFGGYAKEYIKTQDLPLSPKYWLNYFIEIIRKKKRGY